MVTGDELGFADSGEPLQEKSVKSSQLRPSLDAPLHLEDPEDEALLLDTLVELMVVASRGHDMNSGEVLRLGGEVRGGAGTIEWIPMS
jgi:hypothetical protein